MPNKATMAVRLHDGTVLTNPKALHHVDITEKAGVSIDDVKDTGYTVNGKYSSGNPPGSHNNKPAQWVLDQAKAEGYDMREGAATGAKKGIITMPKTKDPSYSSLSDKATKHYLTKNLDPTSSGAKADALKSRKERLSAVKKAVLTPAQAAKEQSMINSVEREVTARDVYQANHPESKVLSKFRTNVGAKKLGPLELPDFGKVAAGAKEAEVVGKAGKVAGKLGKLGIAGLAIYGGIEALKKIGEKLKE